MSKPMLVTLPFVLLLLDYWPLGRMQRSEVRDQRSEAGDTLHAPRSPLPAPRFMLHVSRPTAQSQIANRKSQILLPLLAEKLPFFLLAALGSIATFVVQRSAGAMTGAGGLPLESRAGNALVSYCRYLGKLCWPLDLAVFYPHPGHWPTGKVMLAGGLIFCLTVLVWTWRHRAPYSLTGWLWFIGMLVPVIGFVQVGDQAMADRYTYLPSIGLAIFAVWGAYELVQGKAEVRGQKSEVGDTDHATRTRVQSQIANRKSQILLWVAGGVAIMLCLALTRQQIGYWRDGESLFRHALAVTKDNWMAYNNLGGALEEKGQLDEAILLYREGIRLDPKSADSHNNLGIALGKQGQIDEAIHHLQEAIRLNPNHADAHNNLGNALLGKGQIDEAIIQLQEAIHLRPGNAAAHFNLGVARMNKRQIDEAIRQYQEALRLDPDYAQAHNNLGIAFAGRGQIDLAIDQFQQALNLRPDYADARKNLDIALAAKARSPQPPDATTNR
jgi:protein O-mannosyl-transferase